MKTFFVVAAVACMAIIFVEISQSNAQGGGQRCPGEKPKIQPVDEVKCDKNQGLLGIGGLICKLRCFDCYNQATELARELGCLANRTCVCLGKKDNSTTEAPGGPTTGKPITTKMPTTVSPSTPQGGSNTTVPGGAETTLPGGGETTVTAPVSVTPIE